MIFDTLVVNFFLRPFTARRENGELMGSDWLMTGSRGEIEAVFRSNWGMSALQRTD